MYNQLSSFFEFQNGTIHYHELARIVEMKCLEDKKTNEIDETDNRRVVVATAGTTGEYRLADRLNRASNLFISQRHPCG